MKNDNDWLDLARAICHEQIDDKPATVTVRMACNNAINGLMKSEDPHKAATGYSEMELSLAFDLVCNPDDWRDKICKVVPNSRLDLVVAAITHFTGCVPTTRPLTDNCTVVEAEGYRNGPAGP